MTWTAHLLEVCLVLAPPASSPGSDATVAESATDSDAEGSAADRPSPDAATSATCPEGATPATCSALATGDADSGATAGATAAPQRPQPPPPPPPGGTGAVGGGGHTPLPPPPPPVDPATIRPGPWRGIAWINFGATVGGAIAGDLPAKATVVAVGGVGEVGVRITNWLGVALAFSRQAHDQDAYIIRYPDGSTVREGYRGYMSALDIALLRFFAPVEGRVQPWLDAGAGLAFHEPARAGLEEVGLTLRGTAGVDFWLGRQVTLTTQVGYRADLLKDAAGHSLRGAVLMGAHF